MEVDIRWATVVEEEEKVLKNTLYKKILIEIIKTQSLKQLFQEKAAAVLIVEVMEAGDIRECARFHAEVFSFLRTLKKVYLVNLLMFSL